MSKISIEKVALIIEDRKKRVQGLIPDASGKVDLQEVLRIREGKKAVKVYKEPVDPKGVNMNEALRIIESQRKKVPGVTQETPAVKSSSRMDKVIEKIIKRKTNKVTKWK